MMPARAINLGVCPDHPVIVTTLLADVGILASDCLENLGSRVGTYLLTHTSNDPRESR